MWNLSPISVLLQKIVKLLSGNQSSYVLDFNYQPLLLEFSVFFTNFCHVGGKSADPVLGVQARCRRCDGAETGTDPGANTDGSDDAGKGAREGPAGTRQQTAAAAPRRVS